MDIDQNHSGKEGYNYSEINELSDDIRQKISRVMNVNKRGSDFTIYKTDYAQNLHPNNNLTFLISPDPFELPQRLKDELEIYGKAISAFYKACDSLFRSLSEDHKWKRILTHNRPKWMLKKAKQEQDHLSYLFLRPDFILTKDGVVTTEIETSPFGLALSLFLNNAYSEASIPASKLIQVFISEVTGNDKNQTLCFLITEYTKKYKGQFIYLAKLLKKEGVAAIVGMPNDIRRKGRAYFIENQQIDIIYRAFYLYEALEDENLSEILQSDIKVMPGYKSHLEEKAIMAMLFDPEIEPFFRENLGEYFDVLKEIFPRTYVLEGAPPKELEIDTWQDLASRARKKRTFVLKISGFSNLASWAKGIVFLNKLSQSKCRQVIQKAMENDAIFVIQEFKKGAKFKQEYYNFDDSTIKTMNGKVRFTPYYHSRTGELLTAKATMCENTDFIHASTNSINTPIK